MFSAVFTAFPVRVSALVMVAAVCGLQGVAQQAGSTPAAGATSVTVYNQDFAVVRVPVALDLKAGTTEVVETHVTSQMEPDSVVLRDPTGRQPIRLLEQNYDAAIGVQALMLAKSEGRTIDFAVRSGDRTEIVKGKIIRAGAVPQYDLLERFGQNYFYQTNNAQQQQQPVIEVDGKLMYSLPGIPLFPANDEGLTLKPTMRWLIASERPVKFSAEMDYITRGLRWNASYSLIAPPENGHSDDKVELVGMVNVTNESGLTFKDVRLQLMAGDLSKLLDANGQFRGALSGPAAGIVTMAINGAAGQQQITQKSFDEYHLYDLKRTATLANHESKQIEFLRVPEVQSKRVYVFDGFSVNTRNGQYLQWNNEQFGTSSNKKVWVMQEFKNSEANHLGMPLPQGRMRFYRQGSDGTPQFVGENTIDHTPKDETIRVYTGNSFDMIGERTRTSFQSRNNQSIVESYKITVKNAKEAAAQVRIVEHMYRTATWEVGDHSDDFVGKDSQTIEFPIEVPAHGEKTVRYTVTYTW